MPTPLMPPLPGGFVEDLAELRRRIDQRLERLLPPACGAAELLGEAMRAAVLSPGKRVRPLLLLVTARELGACEQDVLDLGCALELVHAASLVLDDLPCMDDATLRRGVPTVHRRFGEDVAVLAAVALLSQAFRSVSACPGLAPQARAELVALLADAVGAEGLVRGQYEDLREGAGARRPQAIARTNQRKTGVLFAAALDMAGRAAQAGEWQRQALDQVAQDLGQAFQLQDDLLDGQTRDKDAGQDLGKSTLVSVLGQEAARRRLRQHLRRVEVRLQALFGAGNAPAQLIAQLFSQG